MRVKIKGKITVERLAEALQAAVAIYDEARPGNKIYGANLYLSAFDEDGLPFELEDHRGEPLFITIEAKSGELTKPPVTENGKLRQKTKRDEKEAEEGASEEAWAEERRWAEAQDRVRKIDIEMAPQRRAQEELNRLFEEVNAMTLEILRRQPNEFIEELNKVIRESWQEHRPVHQYGQNKGNPYAIPNFFIHDDGRLMLTVETWKKARVMHNPIWTHPRYGQIGPPIWTHMAWNDALNRMVDVLKKFSSEVE